MIWLTVLAHIIYPPLISWATISLPSWIRWLGVAGSITAALLLAWMFTSLGMNITDSVVTRQEHKLVTEGPSRWIRHPLYTFGALLFISLSLIMGTWIIPFLGTPTYAILVQRTGVEEKWSTTALVSGTSAMLNKRVASFPDSFERIKTG